MRGREPLVNTNCPRCLSLVDAGLVAISRGGSRLRKQPMVDNLSALLDKSRLAGIILRRREVRPSLNEQVRWSNGCFPVFGVDARQGLARSTANGPRIRPRNIFPFTPRRLLARIACEFSHVVTPTGTTVCASRYGPHLRTKHRCGPAFFLVHAKGRAGLFLAQRAWHNRAPCPPAFHFPPATSPSGLPCAVRGRRVNLRPSITPCAGARRLPQRCRRQRIPHGLRWAHVGNSRRLSTPNALRGLLPPTTPPS